MSKLRDLGGQTYRQITCNTTHLNEKTLLPIILYPSNINLAYRYLNWFGFGADYLNLQFPHFQNELWLRAEGVYDKILLLLEITRPVD